MTTNDEWAAAAARGEWQRESGAGHREVWVAWRGGWRLTVFEWRYGGWCWEVRPPETEPHEDAIGSIKGPLVHKDADDLKLARRVAESVCLAMAGAPRGLTYEQAAELLGLGAA